ncbi:MAG: hypothetical protein HQK76_05065 [Desulfobacterales bacterium]|nr:hypothetical protein [Desulfobacterales bacterium]
MIVLALETMFGPVKHEIIKEIKSIKALDKLDKVFKELFKCKDIETFQTILHKV